MFEWVALEPALSGSGSSQPVKELAPSPTSCTLAALAMLTAVPTSTDSQTSFRNCVETRQKAGQKTFGLPCTAPGRTLPAFLEPPCRCFPHRRSTKGTVIIACLMTVVAPCCTLFDLHTVWGGPVASQRFNFQCCTILQA